MKNVIKSQLIEVILQGVAGGNNSVKVQFPDQPYLRGKKILGLEMLFSSDMSASPSGRTPTSVTQAQKTYLTLYTNDVERPSDVGEWLQNIPAVDLHRVQNSANDPFVRQTFDLSGQTIYWEKSFFNLSSPFANTDDVSFLINVYFRG